MAFSKKIGVRFDLQGCLISGKFRVNRLFAVNSVAEVECYIPKPILRIIIFLMCDKNAVS